MEEVIQLMIQGLSTKHEATDALASVVVHHKNTPKEISISLFGECNMRCEFCIGNQRHNVQCPSNFNSTICAAKTEIENTDKKKMKFQ